MSGLALDSVHSEEQSIEGNAPDNDEPKDVLAEKPVPVQIEVLAQPEFSSSRGGRVSDGRVYAPNRLRSEEEQMFYNDNKRVGPNSIGGAAKESIFTDSLFEPFKQDYFQPEPQGRASWLQNQHRDFG